MLTMNSSASCGFCPTTASKSVGSIGGSSAQPGGGTCRRPPPEDDLYTNLPQMGAFSCLDGDSGDQGYPPAGTIATNFPTKHGGYSGRQRANLAHRTRGR